MKSRYMGFNEALWGSHRIEGLRKEMVAQIRLIEAEIEKIDEMKAKVLDSRQIDLVEE